MRLLMSSMLYKIKGIVNSVYSLKGTIIEEPKIVRKILRSLLERFHDKINAIEEAKDMRSYIG